MIQSALRTSSLTPSQQTGLNTSFTTKQTFGQKGKKKKKKKKIGPQKNTKYLFVKNSITIQLQKCILSSLYKNKTK